MQQGISPEQLQTIINLAYVLVLAVVGLGTAGIGTAIVVIRQHKELFKMVYAGASPDTQRIIRDIVYGINEAADVAEEIVGSPEGYEEIVSTSNSYTNRKDASSV